MIVATLPGAAELISFKSVSLTCTTLPMPSIRSMRPMMTRDAPSPGRVW